MRGGRRTETAGVGHGQVVGGVDRCGMGTASDNDGMSDPVEFYRSFQTLLRGRGIAGVLTSGMACVEFGLQQTTKDTDWIVDPAEMGNLVAISAGTSSPG